MVNSESEIENEIVSKGLDAPRISPSDIDAVIDAEQYHIFPGTTVTVCCLNLRNGFNVIGHSASVSIENFDAEIGRKIAYNNARNSVWMLEGYLLKERVRGG